MNKTPPILEESLDGDSIFNEEVFNWKEGEESQNQFIHALFSSLNYSILKSNKDRKFVNAGELKLSFKRDFLKVEPIFSNKFYNVFEGVQFIPSLIKKGERLTISFICNRIIRIKGNVKGSPRELQQLSQLNTSSYFNKLSSLLTELIGNTITIIFGNLTIFIKNKLELFKLKPLKDLDRIKKTKEKEIQEYTDDFIFPEELEEEINEKIEEEDSKIIDNELIEYILPIIPSKIEYGVLDEPFLWVGGGKKVRDNTPLYLLNQYGPFQTPGSTLVFIPLYLDNQPNIKDKILKVANYIIFGTGSGLYDFPGLLNRFNLKINLRNPKAIPLNLSDLDFERKITDILEEERNDVPNLPLTFNLRNKINPFFLIGFEENTQKEWGKFTPYYQYIKENLTKLGYPNQVITKFGQFFSDYKSFPLWSTSSAIFSKVGGIPWQIEANYAKDGIPIDAIIGFRFARQRDHNKNLFVLGIATVFSGNGKYLGFKTKSIPIDTIGENYKFILKSHGFTRMYEGLKIPSEDIKDLFSDAKKLIDKTGYHQKNPGAVVVHRLGSVSSEEADAFLDCFNSSKYSAGALISISEHPLKWNINGKIVNRGTWINLNEKSGLLFPQGCASYYQGRINKLYTPKSIPKAFKITIMRDNGVYAKPHDAGYDIMALSRMNWRHATFIPSNYPITLQYALIIAQFYKNNIIPKGDLSETPWFL
ncbi:MAG: hypothetical protein ACTSWE_07610 [Promethearchaeota archaeon]